MGPPLSQPPTNNRTFCNERSLLRAPKYLGRRSRRLPRGVPSPTREESSHPGESSGTELFIKANNSSSWASPERSRRVSSPPQGGQHPAAPWAVLSGRAGGAGRCAAARRPPPHPAPPSPAGPPRPGTKHTAPILSAFVAIWQIHVDTANIHLFRHIMSRNREQLELCLLLLLMRMGDRERERERKNHLTIRDIQLIMNHMCL